MDYWVLVILAWSLGYCTTPMIAFAITMLTVGGYLIGHRNGVVEVLTFLKAGTDEQRGGS